MEQKIGIITDTNACLDYFDHHYDIGIFRSMIHLGEEEYLDHIQLTADEFYKRLRDDKTLFPRTSQYPTQKMIAMYAAMRDKGYTDLLVITISQYMSGIYSAAQVAAQKVENIRVHVIDSKSVAFPQARMALLAAEMAAQNKPLEDIVAAVEHIRDNNHIYFAVDTLAYLVKNGRLSNAAGFLGSMLKIKPLLHISAEGKVETVEKIRTFSRARERVIERYLEETKGHDVVTFICHAGNPEAVKDIEARLKKEDKTISAVFSMPLTPAVGAHAGPGAIGLGYVKKNPKTGL